MRSGSIQLGRQLRAPPQQAFGSSAQRISCTLRHSFRPPVRLLVVLAGIHAAESGICGLPGRRRWPEQPVVLASHRLLGRAFLNTE